jgi:cytochrome c553
MTLPQTLARAAAIAAGASLLAASTWAADHSRAVQIVEEVCSVCHGSDGESGSPAFPRLAGQHAVYVERQLRDYKSGKRKSRAMSAMVEDLKEEDFKALGAYFESRATHKHEIEDPDLAGVGRFVFTRGNPFSGVPACSACHGNNGAGTDKLPRLAGQYAEYVERQLKAFDKRERTNDNAVMHGIASKLTELEVKAVASYVSGLK